MASLLTLLPAHYGYTALPCMLVFPLHLYQIISVDLAREKAKIAYPQFYAEKSESPPGSPAHYFNCCQRAHHNTLELLPQMLFATAFSGLRFPLMAAGCMTTWVVGRVGFTVGYKTGDPGKRSAYGGPLHYVGSAGVMVLGTVAAVGMIL